MLAPGCIALEGVSRVAHVRRIWTLAVAVGCTFLREIHPFVKQNGYVVVTARGLPPVWDRFIFLKELMHIFDDADEATDSGDAFENLLAEFTQHTHTPWSPQMEAEIDSFWMAANAMCPEQSRLELKVRFEADPTQLD